MDGLEQLLAMHGSQVHRDDGYWWKIEAWCVPPTRERPHGIRYNLTLHDKHNRRIFGMDNAHAVKPAKTGLNSGKVHEFDHVHQTMSDTGTPYEFKDCFALLSDFFSGVDKSISDINGGRR